MKRHLPKKTTVKKLLDRVRIKASRVSVTTSQVQMSDRYSTNNTNSTLHTTHVVNSNRDRSEIHTMNQKSSKGTQECLKVSISTIFLKQMTQAMKIINNKLLPLGAARKSSG